MSNDAKTFYENFRQNMGKIQKNAPDMFKGFGGLHQQVMKDSALPLKQKELIALAVGLAVRCEPCIFAHVKGSLDAGAVREEILDAASVAVLMQGGPSYMHVPAVIEALEALGQ